MYLPDYKGGSIVNLMSSIGRAFGWKSPYMPLKGLDVKGLSESTNVVLLVMDGFGYELLKKRAKNTVFSKNLKRKMTSLFPSTTANCIPMFNYGVPAQQHALSAWDVYLKEIGMVATLLPFTLKSARYISLKRYMKPADIFTEKPFYERINVDSYALFPQVLVNTDCTKAMVKKTKRFAYKNDLEMFNRIKRIVKSNDKKKFIHAYNIEIDHLCHDNSPESKKVSAYIKKFDKRSTKIIIS
ncbi:alkaline phosphatase family protein [Nanoarchaeota archaeon]